MSPRLDLPIAVAAWLLGFLWIGQRGEWAPLALIALAAAARLVVFDPETRRLLRPSAAGLALGGAGALGLIAATYGLYLPLSAMLPGLPGATRDLYALLNAAGYPPFALGATVLVVSVCEEVTWRGRTLSGVGTGGRRLDRRAAGRAALLALLYGASSLGSGSVVLFALATGCGLVWGLLRVAGGSLWPAVVAHAAWDLAVLIWWPLG